MARATSRLLLLSCDVVGYAADTATLLDATEQLRPDVVLLDLSLEGRLNVFQACRHIKDSLPSVNVVAFTADDDPNLRSAALEAGASGFVWKLRARAELARTIHMVTDDTAGSADEYGS